MTAKVKEPDTRLALLVMPDGHFRGYGLGQRPDFTKIDETEIRSVAFDSACKSAKLLSEMPVGWRPGVEDDQTPLNGRQSQLKFTLEALHRGSLILPDWATTLYNEVLESKVRK